MASTAYLTTPAAAKLSGFRTGRSSAPKSPSSVQLASQLLGRRLVVATAPRQQRAAKSSVVTAAVTWKEQSGSLKDVSIGDGGTVVGVNVNNTPYQWENNAWKALSGTLTQISTGASGTWGVYQNGDVYRLEKGAWVKVTGANLAQIASGKSVWGVDSSGSIFKYNGSSFEKFDGSLRQIDTNDYGDVWGTNTNNTAFRLVDNKWKKVPGPDGKDNIKQVTTGVFGVWALDTSGAIYRWVLSDTEDGYWFKESGNLSDIDSGYDSVWGVNSNQKVYKYTVA